MRKKLKLVALGLAVGAIVVLATPDGRAAVRGAILRHQVLTGDPADRAKAREALLLLGRPQMQAVLPEVASEEIAARLGPGSAVVVAHWYQAAATPGHQAADARADLEKRHVADRTFYYEVEAVLLDQKELGLAKRQVVLLTGFPESPAGRALWKREATREVLLLERTGDFSPDARLVLAVPVDDEQGPAVLSAIKARLASR